MYTTEQEHIPVSLLAIADEKYFQKLCFASKVELQDCMFTSQWLAVLYKPCERLVGSD